MDFSKFTPVESSNSRKAGGNRAAKTQPYKDMKYRRGLVKGTNTVEGRFFVSNRLFVALGLASEVKEDGTVVNAGFGLRQFTAPDGDFVIGVVSNDDAKILKMSKKGNKTKVFKSDKLEASLVQAKVIDTTKEKTNQYIDLTLVAENVSLKGISCKQVYSMGVGTAIVVDKEPASAPSDSPSPVATTLVPEPTLAAAKEDDGWK